MPLAEIQVPGGPYSCQFPRILIDFTTYIYRSYVCTSISSTTMEYWFAAVPAMALFLHPEIPLVNTNVKISYTKDSAGKILFPKRKIDMNIVSI